ncbi:MAG TPA: hypothetical protein VLH79_02215 [Chthonomonadales bacterium]|nr:hypothetical protein [Chthonomonadales bacterium]
MNTQKAVVITTISLILGGLVGYWFYLAAHRYTLINAGSPGVAYQIDRKTGRTWMIRGGVKREQIDPEQEKLINESLTQRLPVEAWAKVTGNAALSGYSGTFSGRLYNGTEWIITRFVIEVKCMEADGSERWTRAFRVDQEIPPLTTEPFSFAVTGQQGDPKFEWSISDLFGRPE